MAAPNSRFRLRNRLLSRAILTILVLSGSFRLFAQPTNAIPPGRMLYSVVEEEKSFNSHFDGKSGKALTERQTHYVVRFTEIEGFEFHIPEALAFPTFHNPQDTGALTFFNKGFTVYYYDHGEKFLPISNRLLMYRQALLAAETHFTQAARNAGFTLNFAHADPVRIVVGQTTQNTSAAETSFSHHWICFGATGDHSPTVPVHEYFHLVQSAIWYEGKDEYQHQTSLFQKPYSDFLHDMTADWATDEPIQIPASPGYPATNIDLTQNYLNHSGSRFIEEGDQRFFADVDRNYRGIGFKPRQYQASLLIKYWAEQMAGQQDKSSAPQLLKALRRIQQLGGLNHDGFFLGLTEPLPPQFDAPGEEYRWQQFFRHFCASNVIQRASCRKDTNDPIGYHDEAFQSINSTFDNKIERTLRSESRVSFDRIWAEPALTDAERIARLKTLRGGTDEIRALSHKLYLLKLENKRSQPRTIFLHAEGEPGTDLYLLRQQPPLYSEHWRDDGSMDLLSEFTFSDQTDSDSPADFTVVENVDLRRQGDYLWLGLVNGATKSQNRKVRWCYLATPALMEFQSTVHRGDTSTVRLVKGDSLSRWQSDLQQFADGDEFELRIQTSGALHRSEADLNDLRKEDVSLDFKVLDRHNNEVPLEIVNGRTFKVRAKPHQLEPNAWDYFISGKLQSGIDYEGLCRFRICISSPLNLGPQDEQIDESYKFELNPLNPYLDRVEIRQGEQLIYDNHQDLRLPPKEQNGSFTMTVKGTFTRAMDPAKTIITAGPDAPYNQFRVDRVRWPFAGDNKVFVGRLVIPRAEVPASGMLLRLAVNGVTKTDAGVPATPLDSNLLEPGNQPDTSHFLIVGLDEYWEVSHSSSCRQQIESWDQNLTVQGTWGPLRVSTRLVIDSKSNDGRPNVYVQGPEGELSKIEEWIKMTQKSVKELEVDLKKVSAPGFKATREQIQFYTDALQRQRLRHELLTKRIKPAYESWFRVWNGYREIYGKPELCGPVSLSFSGMHVDWGPLGETSYPAWGRLLGDPEFVSDAVAAGNVREDAFLSVAEVWNFWPSDLQKIQHVINLMKTDCPAYVTTPEPKEGPFPMPSDYLRREVWGRVSGLPQLIIDSEARALSKQMWRFFPPSECPFDYAVIEGEYNDELDRRRDWTQLPNPESGRWIHFPEAKDFHHGEYRVTFEMRSHQLYRGNSDAWERSSRDFPEQGDWKKETAWPVGGNRMRQHLLARRTTTEYWEGPERPDRLHSFFDHPVGDRINLYDEEFHDATRWSLADSNCVSRFRTHRGWRSQVYLYPDGDLASSTIRGSIQQVTDQDYTSYDWDTNWTVKRIGDPLPPDPNEPFPEWNEDLGEPPTSDRRSDGNAPGGQSAADSDDPNSEENRTTSEAQEKSSSEQDSGVASSFDPETGITTHSKKNPDGSKTITATDSKGKVRSQKTETKADRERKYGSQFDPKTGEVTTVVGNDDGSRTITVTDRDGNIKSRKTVPEAERKRAWASKRDPRTGRTVTSERLPDGRVRITTRDAYGDLVGDPVYRPEK